MRIVKAAYYRLIEIMLLIGGFLYDGIRFSFYSGSYLKKGRSKRNYRAVKAYHSIEKSLSFRNRNPGSGWTAVSDLYRSIQRYKPASDILTFHEKVGADVVGKLVEVSDKERDLNRDVMISFFNSLGESENKGGVIRKFENNLKEGVLDNPEKFFFSRYSVREFKNRPVDKDLVFRALRLASKTPSVCNRESYFVYYSDEKEVIKKILSLQNGNRGFGDGVPGVFLVASDLRAFTSQIERYQYWIDGGMYAMSLVYALHSLGLGVCCLNWSQSFVSDIRARRLMNIEGNHTVMMLLAVGYPADDLAVCVSARSPIEDHFKWLA